MKATCSELCPLVCQEPDLSWADTMARRAVMTQLQNLEHGELTLIDAGATHRFGRVTADFPVEATVTVHDPRTYRDMALGGTIGAGEAYVEGCWSSDDLTNTVRLLLRNREVMDTMETGTARPTQLLQKVIHRLRHNSRGGARRNIAAHYDLGNAFFALFLDKSMMYSSAVFERDDMTLEEAAIAKLDRVCRKLDLGPGDYVLEIGTGWGGFALHAAARYGCRVTTTTISREQYDMARSRIDQAGLGRVEVLLKDYRDLEGRYDKLVSIEMIEAIGHKQFDTFFEQCSQLLNPEGMMLLQAITIADQRYEQSKRSVDFIQRYVFPGSCLPSVTAMLDSLTRTTDLRLVHLEDIGAHYARTLREWRHRLNENRERVVSLGYSERLVRTWDFYFCYCEGAFAERVVGDAQMLLAKPLSRQEPVLGAVRPRAPVSAIPNAAIQRSSVEADQ